MKFSIIITQAGYIQPSGTDERQYFDAHGAFAGRFPLATIIAYERDGDTVVFSARGEDGTLFTATCEPIYDGSEQAAAMAIGRKLDDRDFGKTATEIVQADDYRMERARD